MEKFKIAKTVQIAKLFKKINALILAISKFWKICHFMFAYSKIWISPEQVKRTKYKLKKKTSSEHATRRRMVYVDLIGLCYACMHAYPRKRVYYGRVRVTLLLLNCNTLIGKRAIMETRVSDKSARPRALVHVVGRYKTNYLLTCTNQEFYYYYCYFTLNPTTAIILQRIDKLIS